jgi:hypothetical protein
VAAADASLWLVIVGSAGVGGLVGSVATAIINQIGLGKEHDRLAQRNEIATRQRILDEKRERVRGALRETIAAVVDLGVVITDMAFGKVEPGEIMSVSRDARDDFQRARVELLLQPGAERIIQIFDNGIVMHYERWAADLLGLAGLQGVGAKDMQNFAQQTREEYVAASKGITDLLAAAHELMTSLEAPAR